MALYMPEDLKFLEPLENDSIFPFGVRELVFHEQLLRIKAGTEMTKLKIFLNAKVCDIIKAFRELWKIDGNNPMTLYMPEDLEFLEPLDRDLVVPLSVRELVIDFKQLVILRAERDVYLTDVVNLSLPIGCTVRDVAELWRSVKNVNAEV
jgi:hypothetical protein